MGLDMFAFTTASRISAVDFPEPPDSKQLHSWRKHPNLHGWIHALYRLKGGKDADFNLVAVKLDLADIDALEQAIREKRLPPTAGFFFGVSDGTETEDDLAFVGKARAALSEDLAVYYVPSW